MPEIINKSLTPPHVSRETHDIFHPYYLELKRWNQTISLMKDLDSYDVFFERHLIDAIDIDPYLSGCVIDIGSGGGIPGIPLAMLGKNVKLVESNTKKSTFLKYCIKKFNLNAECLNKRIETLEIPTEASTISARALAPLNLLLKYQFCVSRETKGVYLKGEKIFEEIKDAKKEWLFEYEIYDRINKRGYIIVVKNVEKKE
ncbi:MAG: Ribosomal RNA small subunit methyltransferase G [Holosporales bacterium]